MRLLVVEDEEGVARFIKKGLVEENYAVDLASDGADGLELGIEQAYDLIILDIQLPKMDGLTVCRELRRRGVQTPVLMLTAKSKVGDRVQGLDSGADDYLVKPFSFEELLARIRALARRKSNVLLDLQVSGLCMDIQAHRVYHGDEEIILRPKEYAILEYLMRNRGRILSRTLILENIWGYDYDAMTNVVDVHIKALRDKLAPLMPTDFIRTVRGMGYMIAD